MSADPNREALIETFLAAHGWGGADRAPLAADASFRTYDRLERGGATAVLMNAPPPMEDVRPFVTIAEKLDALGFTVPVVRARDLDHGLLLLDDLGDRTYTRLLAGGESEEGLYTLAVEVLIALHSHPVAEVVPPGLPRYDAEHALAEAALLTDWFLPAMTGQETDAKVRAAYLAAFERLLPAGWDVPATLTLRDFHVDNLMIVPEREDIATCGLLDFQDALRGPVTYDLMSLLEDARRDVDPAMAARLVAHYLRFFPDIDREAFDLSRAFWAAQRHAKVIGIFTRLKVRDGKDVYLDHIPRCWRMLERALDHPGLADLAEWFDTHVPRAIRRRPAL